MATVYLADDLTDATAENRAPGTEQSNARKVSRTTTGGIMTRAIVFLMTLMFGLPSDGSAQAVPSPGDRIRIK